MTAELKNDVGESTICVIPSSRLLPNVGRVSAASVSLRAIGGNARSRPRRWLHQFVAKY
jgi:hypothetical protein